METAYYQQYRTGFSAMKAQVMERESHKKARHELKDFQFVSANLFNFLPEIPSDQHEDIYLDILSNHALLTTEPNFPELINLIDIEGDTRFLEGNRLPAIFCTYHLGSYRSIIGFLAKAGIDFVLIVDTHTFQRQRAAIKSTVESIQQHFDKNSFFETVDAERVDIALALSKYLLSGVSVVAYLDGNTGVGGVYSKNDQMVTVNFLNQPLASRKGITTMSFATKRPIIPVISYYKKKEGAATLYFEKPIDPKAGNQSRDQYCFDATSHLYALLAERLKIYYNQWEGWLYLHKYLDFRAISPQISSQSNSVMSAVNSRLVVFNDREFGLFKMEADAYLFHKALYKSYPIKGWLFEALHRVKERPGVLDSDQPVSESLFRDLLQKRIILVA